MGRHARCSPSTLRLSDLAFLLLAASALCAAASCFALSRISFSLLFLAAAPLSFEPFLPVKVLSVSGDWLRLEEVSELLVAVRWRLVVGLRLFHS